MKLNQSHKISSKITNLIIDIEANKKALSLLPTNKKRIERLRAKSFLKSGLYSAKIEGNPLTEADYQYSDNELHKLEINNIVKSLEWLYNSKHNLNVELVRFLHQKALHNLRSDAGHFRTEQSAIFNSAGVAIYLTPPASEIKQTLNQIIDNFQKNEEHILIKIALFHYRFEKLHPFIDGNGRVGRLLTNKQLFDYSYSLQGSISLDQSIENNRQIYYDTLNQESNDVTQFIEFFLDALKTSQSNALSSLSTAKGEKSLNLPPRRAEILAIIKDHSPISFDQIHRRFMGVKESTLHYDLQQLQKTNLIKKLGNSRGALYTT